MKTKTQSALIITPEKLAIFNEGFCNCDLCQLSDIYIVSFLLSFVARGAGYHKLCTQYTKVCQQVCCACQVSGGSTKYCMPI